MTALRDGLGGEGLIGSYPLGSPFATRDVATYVFTLPVIVTDSISGLNIFALGSVLAPVFSGLIVSAGSMIEAGGRVRASSIGSPAISGAFIQGGSTATTAGSLGIINFGIGWSAAGNYYVQLTVGSWQGVGEGSVVPVVSGLYRASGVSFIGAASTLYNWLAVGN